MAEKKLLQAIDDAFHPTGIATFLPLLQVRSARIHSLEEASSDLTTFLAGGAYGRGGTFETSFLTLYDGLGKEAQERVREHYNSRLENVSDSLKRKFSKVFRQLKSLATD